MSEEHAEHHGASYFKTYIILLVLMFASLIGSEIGAKTDLLVVTLFSAFGIAVVKAYLVASRFMHLNIEKRWVVYMITTCLAFMALFYSAIAPDIQRHTGTNWIKPAWIERETAWANGTWVDPHAPAHGSEHGDGHGGEGAASEHH